MPPQPQAMLAQAMRDFQAVRGFRVCAGSEVWLRSAFRCAVCAGAMKIGVPPMGLAVRMELGRLAFRREGWRSAWKYNAGLSQHSLPYDAGLEKEDGRTRE